MARALPIDDDRPDAPGERVPYVAAERDGRPARERSLSPQRQQGAPRQETLPQRREAAPQPRQQALPDAAPHDPNEGSGWLPPDEMERQNKRAHAELGKNYDPKRLLSVNLTSEVARIGARAVQETFGIGAGAVPEDGNVQALASNAGAPTAADMRLAKQTVDPNNELPPHLQSAAAANGLYLYHLAKGDPAGAKKAAESTVMYVRKVMHQIGPMIQAALEDGNMDRAAKLFELLYDEVPDGRRLEAIKKGEDKLELKFYDEDDNLTEQGEFVMNQLFEIATGLQNGTVWFRELGAMSRPRRPSASGSGGGGTAAERRAAAQQEQYQQSVEEILNAEGLSDNAKEFAIVALTADRNWEAASSRNTNKDQRELIERHLAKIGEADGVFESEDDPDGARHSLVTAMELATRIWERSPVSDPRTAADIAYNLMYNLDEEIGWTNDFQLMYKRTPINLSSSAFAKLMEHREEMKRRLREAEEGDNFTPTGRALRGAGRVIGDAAAPVIKREREAAGRAVKALRGAWERFTEWGSAHNRNAAKKERDDGPQDPGPLRSRSPGDTLARERRQDTVRSRETPIRQRNTPAKPAQDDPPDNPQIEKIREGWRRLQVMHENGSSGMTDEQFERARARHAQMARDLGFELEAR